jgi:hypothetical protein
LAWNGLSSDQRASNPAAPLEIATRFEAGQVLEGAIVHAGTRLTINAWLRRVPDGMEIARHTASGEVDSLGRLIEQMAAGLLGAQLGEGGERLAGLSRHGPQAVRAYLAGMKALRDGQMVQALLQFERAEDLDSTFALPSLRIGMMLDAVQKPGESDSEVWARWERSLRRAHVLQDDLSERDRAALTYALVHAGVDTVQSGAATLQAAKRWVALAPDDPDAAIEYYGKGLQMQGALSRESGWEARLRAARERAWALDSITSRRVLEHAWLGGLYAGDLEWARRVAPTLLARVDSNADRWAGARWALAHLIGDSSTVRESRERARRLDPGVVNLNTWLMLVDVSARGFVPARDLQLVEELLDESELREIRLWSLIPRGKVRDGARVLLDAHRWGPLIAWSYGFAGLDSAAGMAADSLSRLVTRAPVPVQNACYLELYRVVHGDTAGLRDRMALLAPGFRDLRERRQRPVFGICPAMVEALLEGLGPRRAESPALEQLEALLRLGPGMEVPAIPGVLAVARLLRQRGELHRALQWLEDTRYWGLAVSRHFQAPYAREEGELALLVSDTTRAIRAFQRYLNIRVAPDPGVVQAEVDSVRAALDALLRAKG